MCCVTSIILQTSRVSSETPTTDSASVTRSLLYACGSLVLLIGSMDYTPTYILFKLKYEHEERWLASYSPRRSRAGLVLGLGSVGCYYRTARLAIPIITSGWGITIGSDMSSIGSSSRTASGGGSCIDGLRTVLRPIVPHHAWRHSSGLRRLRTGFAQLIDAAFPRAHLSNTMIDQA